MNQIIQLPEESLLPIEERNGLNTVDSRLVADGLGIQHESLMEGIMDYQGKIESLFGKIEFSDLKPENPRGGRPKKIAYLTEDQCLFLGTLSRNTERVVDFKAKLVKSFQQIRRQVLTLAMPNFSNPAEAARAWAEEYEQRQLASQQLAEAQLTIRKQANKVAFAEKVLDTSECFNSSTIGAEHGISAQALHKILRAVGVLRFGSGDGLWLLLPPYSGQGYAHLATDTYKGKEIPNHAKLRLKWTHKGRAFIWWLFTKKIDYLAILKTVQKTPIRVRQEPYLPDDSELGQFQSTR